MVVIQPRGPCLEWAAVIYLTNAFTDDGCYFNSPPRKENYVNTFTSILILSIAQNFIVCRLQHISALHKTDGTDEAANSVAAGGDAVESSQFAHITISEQQLQAAQLFLRSLEAQRQL